jgi:hypothetical protein
MNVFTKVAYWYTISSFYYNPYYLLNIWEKNKTPIFNGEWIVEYKPYREKNML